MKIIVSPSKTQATMSSELNKPVNYIFKEKTNKIFSILNSMSKEKLGKTLKIKNKLLDQVFDLYKNYNRAGNTIKTIDCYKGVVFEQLDISNYDKSQLNYMESHLIILSAMYGVLNANTIIYPYRLDMTIKPKNINLYQYWQLEVNQYFAEEELIINLASEEFSKMISKHKNKIINIYFKEIDNQKKLKTVSYNAKKARGKMLDLMIKNKVNEIDEIKKYKVDDYIFDRSLSDEYNMYFVK